jgi:hypothetical protein
MLGTANYTNGETVGTGTFASNPSGDPAPFDRLIGDKTNGPNPSTSFTFAAYGGPIASPISSATIEIGLYDGASPSPSTEVQFLRSTEPTSLRTYRSLSRPTTRASKLRSTSPAPTCGAAAGHRLSPSGSRARVRPRGPTLHPIRPRLRHLTINTGANPPPSTRSCPPSCCC